MKDKNRVDVMVGDILRAETLPNDWVVLYHSGDGGVAIRDIVTGEPGGAFFSDAWEVIRRADGSDPRQQQYANDWANQMAIAAQSHVNQGIIQGLAQQMVANQGPGLGCQFDTGDWAALTSVLRLLHKPFPRQPHELYAEFRKVVEETVRREAPKVLVVTDWSGPAAYYWLSLGNKRVTGHISVDATRGRVVDLVLRSINGMRSMMDPLR